MKLFKIQNYHITIIFVTILLLSLKWILSYLNFPEEDFSLRSMFEITDSSYFPLIKSFWMIALPINFITGIVARIFPYALIFIAGIPIFIFILIGLWRSADNYIKNKKKKENKFWGYFVKGQIVLAVILIPLSFLIFFRFLLFIVS